MAGPGNAQSPDAFDSAIEIGDYLAAVKALDPLARQHAGKAGGDPVLDAAYGRFLAAQGQGSLAEPYLRRAIAASTDKKERDMLAFELARAREVSGFVAKAEADYDRLSGQQSGPDIRARATVSLARLRLGAKPDEAIALLAPLTGEASPAATRWEAQLLLSRAYAISGQAAQAKAALAKAWDEAPRAPVPSDAITVTAMDMSVDHAAAGDRAAEIGLVAIGRPNNGFAGLSQLPVCDKTLRPEDSVTVAIQADEKGRPVYSAVRASRPGIAQLFTVPLALARQRIGGPASYLNLHCRSALDAKVQFASDMLPNIGTWMAEKGYFPLFRPIDPTAGDPRSQLKEAMESLESSAGPDTPVLVPLLLQLSMMQAANSRFSNQQQFAEAKVIGDRALAILVKAGAPEEVIEAVRMQTTVAFAQNQNVPDVAGPAALHVLDVLAARAGTTPTQAYAAYDALSQWQLRPTQRLALADRLIAFFDARKLAPTDPVRQAMELRRAAILREIGTVSGMGSRLQAHGLAADLCPTADQTPSIPPAAITLTSDDYPKDLLRRDVTGITTVELSIDADGKVLGQRVVASQPVGLFDQITTDKLKMVTLNPARREDKAIACRGMVQSVRWQVPYRGDFSPPWEGMVSDD